MSIIQTVVVTPILAAWVIEVTRASGNRLPIGHNITLHLLGIHPQQEQRQPYSQKDSPSHLMKYTIYEKPQIYIFSIRTGWIEPVLINSALLILSGIFECVQRVLLNEKKCIFAVCI